MTQFVTWESHLIDNAMALEPNGLNRRDELLYLKIHILLNFSYLVLFFFFFLECVVRHFRLSLLNNIYCDILHLYNIVIPT